MIALLAQSCLPALDRVTVDPMTLLQGLLSAPAADTGSNTGITFFTTRFLFVTSGSHNGNFAGDGTLQGTGGIQKADYYCSMTANRPPSLLGPENYRAVLSDGTNRSSTIGLQLNWPLRSGVQYLGHDGTPVAIANTDHVFSLPALNPITGGGNYWTGIDTVSLWNSSNNCNLWANGTISYSGAYGTGTNTTQSLIHQSTQACDALKGLLCVQDLRDRGDGTISSAYQDLLWQKCEVGQIWDGSSCTGAAAIVQYCNVLNDSCNGGSPTGSLDGSGVSQAYNYCNSLTLGGRSWRVPVRAELVELFRATRQDTSLFPGLTTMQYYWSRESQSTTKAYGILFAGGTTGVLNKTTPYRLRCVSDGM